MSRFRAEIPYDEPKKISMSRPEMPIRGKEKEGHTKKIESRKENFQKKNDKDRSRQTFDINEGDERSQN